MYPISLNLEGKLCVVIGGGKVAERRIAGLIAQGAQIALVAPDAAPGLHDLAASGALDWRREKYDSKLLDGAFLVIAATNDRNVNGAVARDAQARNILVCRTDEYGDGNFTTPAVVRRGSLVFTVTTEGQSPTLTAILRERLAQEFDGKWEAITALLGKLRPAIQQIDDVKDRKRMASQIIDDDRILALLEQGQPLEAEARAQCLLSSWE